MKRFLALILSLCFMLGCLAGCSESTEATPEVQEESTVENVQEMPAIEIQEIDLEKLYAAYKPEEVVVTVDGNDITWADYFYLVYANCQELMNYFNSMANYYGISVSWADSMGEGYDYTYASYVPKSIENSLISLMTIKGLANQEKVELSAENLEAIAAQLQSDIAYMCGEGATEDDFNKYLETIYMPREMYEEINEINFLYQETFIKKYGKDSELVSDKEAQNYLVENGYMAADHILLATIDLSTQQALEESAVNEKKAQAESIVSELSAIKDKKELLEKFKELKAQYTEDTGAAYYPDGYIFTTGKMVPEFEDCAKSLGEYELSDIVETSYGYHILLGMPLSPDGLVDYSSEGTPMNARMMFANTDYGVKLDEYASNVKVEYVNNFQFPDLTEYIK